MGAPNLSEVGLRGAGMMLEMASVSSAACGVDSNGLATCLSDSVSKAVVPKGGVGSFRSMLLSGDRFPERRSTDCQRQYSFKGE